MKPLATVQLDDHHNEHNEHIPARFHFIYSGDFSESTPHPLVDYFIDNVCKNGYPISVPSVEGPGALSSDFHLIYVVNELFGDFNYRSLYCSPTYVEVLATGCDRLFYCSSSPLTKLHECQALSSFVLIDLSMSFSRPSETIEPIYVLNGSVEWISDVCWNWWNEVGRGDDGDKTVGLEVFVY